MNAWPIYDGREMSGGRVDPIVDPGGSYLGEQTT